ncbi:LysE family translocator [Marinobacter nanhaiticus D15-8W]|uniref:LysE family translocator n=1 Tax=Marinobacter nanhaiticus D15-8W TaxID=626887 RepID=N6VRY3_9GAMM|nr:LysE family translocator [Marinobacter nanhaiticus]ENO12955.1 LysE family translocator [Marinobacter nanhaiticus D15-8W]BES70306.1 LysE family translocator [Marinobacter nanhaiticus D15-8W]
MSISTWLLFIAAAAVSILSPGPAVLVALRNGMSGDIRKVVLSSLGNVCGLLAIAGFAVLGLGVVLKTSEWLFLLLKLLGAAYLIYLGVRQWRSHGFVLSPSGQGEHRTGVRLFTEGLLVAVSNPKAILFFTALFPQFLDTGRPVWPQFLLMVGTFMAFSFLTLVAYGTLAKRITRILNSARRTRWFNRILGGAFVSLGISVMRLKQPV